MTDLSLLERSIVRQLVDLAALRPSPGLNPAAGALVVNALTDSRRALFGVLRAVPALREENPE